MKILITGCDGFIGSHLAEWSSNKNDVVGTYIKKTRNTDHLGDKVKFLKCDMRDKKDVENIAAEAPDLVFHMAAQSLVTESWKDPEDTLKTNVMGTFYLLESLRKLKKDCKIIIACSSAEYGTSKSDEIPINEDKKFRPMSPYAVSKVTQDMLGYQYSQNYGMDIVRARLFNITGTRKINDACSDITQRVANIEKGKESALQVGNLDTVRDITDVRDCVKALFLLAERGRSETYNVCSGKGTKIGDIVNILKNLSEKEIEVKQNEALIRVSDEPIILGDNTKIKRLGWKPEIGLEQTLRDMLNYWRGLD